MVFEVSTLTNLSICPLIKGEQERSRDQRRAMRVILFLMHFRFGVLSRVELQKTPAADKNATGGSFHFLSFQVTAVVLCVCCSEITTETPSVILEKTEKQQDSAPNYQSHNLQIRFLLLCMLLFLLQCLFQISCPCTCCVQQQYGILFIQHQHLIQFLPKKQLCFLSFFPSSAPCVVITQEMSQMLQHLMLYDTMPHNISNLGPHLFFSPCKRCS